MSAPEEHAPTGGAAAPTRSDPMSDSAIDNERRLERLRGRLAEQMALKEVLVTLPRAGRTFAILAPSDHDRLLDEVETDPEQNLPYWAEIWPSGIALADHALAHADELAGLPTLELGSGIGITAAGALLAGADLLAADYSAVSLTLCRYNTRCNTGREPRTIEINWRAPSEGLLARADAIRGFPRLLAADVLYEARDIAPLLALIGRLLAPDGALWLAEPGRDTARHFLAAATQLGWQITSERHNGPWTDNAEVKVGVHVIRRPQQD